MRADMVVVAAPRLDHDVCFRAAAEPLERQALVPELAVEAFIGSVLPGFAGFNQRGVNARVCQPGKDGVADELRSVVRSNVTRCTALGDQAREDFDQLRQRLQQEPWSPPPQ